MNSKQISKNTKRTSSSDLIQNTSSKNKVSKFSSNKVKSNNDININKKKLAKTNSPIKVTDKNSNILKDKDSSKDNSIIIQSNLINLENIEISSYNSNPYIIPKKKYDHNLYITKIESTVNNYNKIKENLTKKILDNKIPKKSQSMQIKNFALLEELDKLSTILDTLVEKKRYVPKNNTKDNNNKVEKEKEKNSDKKEDKNKPTKLDINKKLLQNFAKQYNILSEKYSKLSNEEYIKKLKNEQTTLSLEISKIEDDNKVLKNNQINNEYKIKKINISSNDSEYKDKMTIWQRYENEYNSIRKKIAPMEESIKYYEERIMKLNKEKEDLIKKAKEQYNIDNPEKKCKQKDNEDISKNYLKKRELEFSNITKKSKVQKYEYQKKENGKYIKQLIDDKMTSTSLLKEKTELLKKLNKNLDDLELENRNLEANQINENNKKINNNLNNNSNTNNSNISNEKASSQNKSFITPIKSQDNNAYEKINNNISKINNRYDNTAKNNNSQTYNKKMVLENLKLQSHQENLLKMDKSIGLKKNNKLKPNFSFTLNDINSNSKDKKVNLSVALQPNKNINIEKNENEGEEEIKEDIYINSNINEDKKEEEQNIINLSQNEENDEGKIRENDLNTVVYKEFDIKKEENKSNFKFNNSDEQENDYENEEFNMEDNQNINMD